MYSSINEEQAMTSAPPPAASVSAGEGGGRQAVSASSHWLRLRLHGGGSGGSGGRVLPQALLGQRRRQPSSSSLPRRDYSVDKLTDAVFHEYLRHDPQLDAVRRSPLIVRTSSDTIAAVTAARRHGRQVNTRPVTGWRHDLRRDGCTSSR